LYDLNEEDSLVAEKEMVAIDLVRKKEYSIVLMDLQMPEMDVYEATNKILGLHPKIPTIVLSADTTNIDREKLESKGFRELPQKPLFS